MGRCVPSATFYAGHVLWAPSPISLFLERSTISHLIFSMYLFISAAGPRAPAPWSHRPPRVRSYTLPPLLLHLILFLSLLPLSSSLTSQPICPSPSRMVVGYYDWAPTGSCALPPLLGRRALLSARLTSRSRTSRISGLRPGVATAAPAARRQLQAPVFATMLLFQISAHFDYCVGVVL